jgi:serine protease Do
VISSNRSMAKPSGIPHRFNRVLDGTPPRAVVVLGIVRDGRDRSIIASVGSRPVPANAPPLQATANEEIRGREKHLGLQLAPAGTGGGEGRGARVIAVDPLGLAAGRGIDPGDVILDVSNQEIRVPDDVYRLIADAQRAGKRSILMRKNRWVRPVHTSGTRVSAPRG